MKLLTLGLAIILSLVLLGSVGPVVQAESDNATVNLEVEVVEPGDGDEVGVGGVGGRVYIDTNLFGAERSFRISATGAILKTIKATSADGMLTITIAYGTIALNKKGNPLGSLEVNVDESPPDPPEDAHIIWLPYKFEPTGATFDPGITLEWSYDPDDIPEGVDEEDLVLAYYDEEAGEWVELDCVVDTENNTITASVSHFTTFAIIGVTPPLPPVPATFKLSSLSISPAEVNIGETVTISLLVANIGGRSGSRTVTLKINGVVEATKEVTVSASFAKEVTFSVTKEDAGSYSIVVNGLSDSFTVVAPAAFSVLNLSIQPAEAEPGQAVIITVSVANTGGTEGSYTVVLKLNGVKEAEKSVTIAAGSRLDFSFVVSREAGSYTITVDGLSGSFTVVPVVTPLAPTNWPLIIGAIVVAVVVVGLLVFFLVIRRRTD